MSDREGQAETLGAVNMHYDRDLCLHEMLRVQARAAPRTTALVFGDVGINYQDLDRSQYKGLAYYLQDRLFLIDYESLTSNEISQTILIPSFKNRV